MAEMFYDDDADLSIIQGRKVAVIGYGSQGHAHALTPARLRRRRAGRPARRARRAAPRPRRRACGSSIPATAAAEADVIMILVPDPVQAALYKEAIEPNLQEGDALFFAHGFNIRFGYITPPDGVDVVHGRPEGPRSPRAS